MLERDTLLESETGSIKRALAAASRAAALPHTSSGAASSPAPVSGHVAHEGVAQGARQSVVPPAQGAAPGQAALPLPRWLSGRTAWMGLVVPLLLIAAWEYLCQAGVFPPWQLPAPSYVLGTLAELHASGELYFHSWASVRRVLIGFAIGGSLGLLVGVTVGVSRVFERLVDTTLQAIKSVPTLGWVPLLILWFGIDETPKLVLISIGAFFPVYVNVVSGIRGVDTKLVEVGRVFCLGRLSLLGRIVLPAASPAFFTGIRVGLTQSWLFMVIAELMGASEGLGFLLTTGREVARPDLLLGSLVVLAILGKLADTLVRAAEGALLGWRESYHG